MWLTILTYAAALAGLAAAVDEPGFAPRSFDGTGNNEDNPEWGAAGTSQVRARADAAYADVTFSPVGGSRPTARELMRDVFLASSPDVTHSLNAVAIGWGQLLLLDLSLTMDKSSEPFNAPCADPVDVWCPLGEASDPIPFYRSDAEVTATSRNPINYATSYIDLDFVYGRSKDESDRLRGVDGDGKLAIGDDGLPVKNDDGTWLIADQRTARLPVAFALHTILLLEHNRCCDEIAPGMGYVGDEDIFQACRGWTIATFQHVTEDDFLIQLLGSSVGDLTVYGEAASRRKLYSSSSMSLPPSPAPGRRELLFTFEYYDPTADPSADVFVAGAVAAAFESALPATLRIVSEGYVPTDYDQIELTVASADIPGLFENNDIADILRGAVLSPVSNIDTHFTAAVSNVSPLFKVPVDAIQRGRDHGLPTYNDVRQAYGLLEAGNFAAVSSNSEVAELLSQAYGNDIDNLDVFTGALAEDKEAVRGGVLGELLHTALVDQLYRSFFGDRFHHLHSRPIENVSLVSISELISRTLNVTDLPQSGFEAPAVNVCTEDCVAGDLLAERFGLSWEVGYDERISISVRASGIGNRGMLGIGFGGHTMTDAQDYVICEVLSETAAECIDRAPSGGRALPEPDTQDPDLEVTDVSIEGGWTTVTFLKPKAPLDDQDYDLGKDVERESDTKVIYSFKTGEGVGQHPNTHRGAATVNFATGDVETKCDGETNFVSLHGALMLIAWMLIAPMGIYYVRYRKGDAIKWAGREWYDMHADIMIVASEAVLPLGITAVFASRGRTSAAHAHWGYYMIGAVALQIFTGWLRTKGLEAKHSNFSLLHRFNKHFHIWAGRFAYAAGVIQCYRGLELVSSDDELMFSAGDGLDLQLGSFGWVKDYLFPVWFVLVAGVFLVLETRKQARRFFAKGAASVCGVVSIVNEFHDDSMHKVDGRLIPRTMDLPVYSVAAFNDKVLSGQSWVMADDAILDVSDFAQRHPGGRRLILNAVGTDVTQELIGRDQSVGHAMAFSPHVHSGKAWRIIRSLVVGYIAEKEDPGGVMAEDEDKDDGGGATITNPFSDGKRSKNEAAAGAPGKSVLLFNNRQSLGADNLASKAMRLNDLAAIPIPPPAKRPASELRVLTEKTQSTGSLFANQPKEVDIKAGWSSSSDLERFHVCPLLFRERMGAPTAVGRGHLPSKRPVYRYIFSCPGKAQAQAEAISGVCYFNMRAQEDGKGIVQRAYNAFAVRLQDVEPPTPGGRITWRGGRGNGPAKIPKVVPAAETTEGVLCIEFRIRMYHDGAMSKLLEKLSKDTDNAVVQLQGPFLIGKLAPPPAHHNVVMIAAGTGVNPMIQQIRDYMQNTPTDSKFSTRSRLVLLWQTTCEADFFGTDEVTALQEKSNGLLEVTALISEGGRRKNIPGAAFRKMGTMARNVFSSPGASSISSSGSSVNPFTGPLDGSGKPPAYMTPNRTGRGDQPPPPYVTPGRGGAQMPPTLQAEAGAKEKNSPTGVGKLLHKKTWRNLQRADNSTPGTRRQVHDTYQVGDGLVRGKVNRAILEAVFGEPLMASLASHNSQQAVRNLLRSDSEDLGERKDAPDDGAVDLVGTDDSPGKLQVVVSGPSEFVLNVAQLLTEIGVPSGAVVLLD